VGSDPDDSRATLAPFFHAWVEALHEWDWQGRTRLDLNLRAFDLRYNVDWHNPVIPPWRLVSEWHDDGCPEPDAWIEVKLAMMLRQYRPHGLAI
jgi:hypothetical protein